VGKTAGGHRNWQMLGSDERLKLGFRDCLCQPASERPRRRPTDGGGGGTAVSRGCGSVVSRYRE
jgi:hypothetical protein